MSTKSLEEIIDDTIGEVQTTAIDLTFGEIVNLYSAEPKEIIIQPEYQRLFRWSDEQRSRLIESIILGLPIPQIFVVERENSVLELIDGLQRISSVIQFINHSVLEQQDLPPLELQGCDLVPALNGKKFDDLSLRIKLNIKRSSVRTIIIKRQSKSELRYAMFKRLNTGGATLEPQEIRNCSARMLGKDGIDFYSFLQNKASHPDFLNCIETLSQSAKEQKGDEELVLRFFATKNATNLFKGNVGNWLDDYMEKVLLKNIEFDYKKEEEDFNQVFSLLSHSLGEGSFVKYKGEKPIGGLAPAYYEAISVGTFRVIGRIHNISPNRIKEKIILTVQTDEFRANTGSGANKREKLEGRIKVIQDALLELIDE